MRGVNIQAMVLLFFFQLSVKKYFQMRTQPQ